MLYYIVQIMVCQLLFVLVYDIFLKRETFFNWNRAYLLTTTILSFIIPSIKIEQFKTIVSKNYLITLPEILIGNQQPIFLNPVIIESQKTSNFQWTWSYVLILGSSMMLFVFVFKLLKIIRLYRFGIKQKKKNTTIVKLHNSNMAFSFFNIIFIGDLVKLQEQETILKHELIHVKQKHSFDMILFELLKIVLWFNPFTYMYQQRMSHLHEFIADSKVAKQEEKKQYYLNLLSQLFDTNRIAFINPFFKQSLIKKRIVMLQKSKSKQIKLVKYTLLIPVVLGMLVYSSCSETEHDINSQAQTNETQLKTIVNNIDVENKLTDEQKTNIANYMLKNIEAIITNPNSLNAITQIKQVENNYSVSGEVPFSVIDKVPQFADTDCPGDKKVKTECFNWKINKLVAGNFNTKVAKGLGLLGDQKIAVFFKINAQGQVTDVKARAAHKVLQEEAIRVIKLLPQIIPGEHQGKKVTVPYYLPIKFQINE